MERIAHQCITTSIHGCLDGSCDGLVMVVVVALEIVVVVVAVLANDQLHEREAQYNKT
jgi:hypothetical protein